MKAPNPNETPRPGSLKRVVSRLRRRYTRVVKIGDKWNTYLQIDHQGFCVVEQTCHHRARWFANNLAIALERMLAANIKAEPPPVSGGEAQRKHPNGK